MVCSGGQECPFSVTDAEGDWFPVIRALLGGELEVLQVGGAGLVREDGVALGAGLGQRFGAEGFADAFLGDGRGVHDVVDEPRAVVIPQMMIGILRVGAERELKHDVF